MNQAYCLALAVLIVGCRREASTVESSWTLSAAKLAADHVPGPDARLTLAGTPFDVTLKSRREGSTLRFDLLAHGASIEHETYEVSAGTFAVREAGGEIYRPALPIVRFPLRVGDQFVWHGRLVEGDEERPAHAVIESMPESIYVGGRARETVRVNADLALESAGNEGPVRRRLAFWFDPGVGIVRREFGTASVREASGD